MNLESCHDANSVVTGGTLDSHNDNLRCHQWQQSWYHGNSQFSVKVVVDMSCICDVVGIGKHSKLLHFFFIHINLGLWVLIKWKGMKTMNIIQFLHFFNMQITMILRPYDMPSVNHSLNHKPAWQLYTHFIQIPGVF